MIDLHSHILPGLDDGCESVAQAVEMSRIYAEEGFHTVVATPHYLRGTSWCPDPRTISQGVDEINRALSAQGQPSPSQPTYGNYTSVAGLWRTGSGHS